MKTKLTTILGVIIATVALVSGTTIIALGSNQVFA